VRDVRGRVVGQRDAHRGIVALRRRGRQGEREWLAVDREPCVGRREAHAEQVAEVTPGDDDLVAEQGAALPVRQPDLLDERQADAGHRVDAAVRFAAPQHGKLGARRPRALDEHDVDLIGGGNAVLRLERRPELRHLLERQRLRRDPDALDLRVKIVAGQRGADLVGAQQRMIVEHAHRRAEPPMTQQVVVSLAERGDQVVEVQGERRLADVAAPRLPREIRVAPGSVEARLVQEQVQLIGVVRPGSRAIGRPRRHVVAGELGHTSHQQLSKRGRDRRDRQLVAHRSPGARRCRRYSPSVIADDVDADVDARATAGAAAARISTRPMLT